MFETQNSFWQDSFIGQWANNEIILMANWKWFAIVALLFIGWFIKHSVRFLLQKIQNNNGQTAGFSYFTKLLLMINADRSVSWILTCALWLHFMADLELHKAIEKPLILLIQIILAYFSIRMLYLLTEAFGRYFESYIERTEKDIDSQFISLVRKTLKVFVILLGALVCLQNFGINVVSILAGLGIGGLAIAFAAQETVANLFGSITIIFDKPFRVGDHIKVATYEGIVEEIGFRSTRIRTVHKSLLTIPNSLMAKETVENMNARPHRRIRVVLGLTYNTPNEKMKAFCEGVRTIFYEHHKNTKLDTSVYFTEFGSFSLNITAVGFFNVMTGEEELTTQQELFFAINMLSQRLEVEFAFPTQTVLLQNTTSPTQG